MRFNTLVLAALTAISVAAHPRRREAVGDEFICGAPDPTEAQLAATAELAQQEAMLSSNISLVNRQTTSITVDLYFHVVASSTSVSDGYVTDAQLSNQLQVMNDAYGPYGISFNLKGTDRTVNSVYATDGNELAMKKLLRKGDYKTLNVYFQKSLGSGILGYCYFPTNAASGSNDFYYDGCTILYSSVPGGSATNYNQGQTATHEIGHWFGLYHTFQGNSCSGSGDLISDTPQQASSTNGCPSSRDSCPSVAGADPIHNYMDYSYDSCLTEFTAGQKTRIYSQWNTYRA